ncbi:unnamed protein product [Closterium sp. NIES-64]|nr:unnamed protein product [Closterium sp. NIES-64]
MGLPLILRVLPWLTVFLSVLLARPAWSLPPPLRTAIRGPGQARYSACDTGKGRAVLYNCGLQVGNATAGIASLHDVPSAQNYLVKLRPDVPASRVDEICDLAESSNSTLYTGTCLKRFKALFNGMLMSISGQSLLALLDAESALVQFVEVEGHALIASAPPPSAAAVAAAAAAAAASTSIATTTAGADATAADDGDASGGGLDGSSSNSSAVLASASLVTRTQRKPLSWGLDRIDQRPGAPALDGAYSYPASAGAGVHVYVVDTGVRCSHSDFYFSDGRINPATRRPASRCLPGVDTVGDGRGQGMADCNGHGTHCAGTVAGLLSGVAKSAFIHPVRTMDCAGNGAFGDILEGLDWIARHYQAPAVVSMSITMATSASLDAALKELVEKTAITVVAAAGNFFSLACNYSPADSDDVIAVASSTSSDTMSWFSNYGSCTDIFAPGDEIVSAGSASDTAMATMSGTSMACPHVSGAAALYLSMQPSARPRDVRKALYDTAYQKAVQAVKPSTVPRLLSVNFRPLLVDVAPRSFLSMLEGATARIKVLLLKAPGADVVLTATAADASVASFSPPRLTFPARRTPAAQYITIQLAYSPKYLDRTTLLAFTFTSKDSAFGASLEGYAVALDKDVCKAPCGQSVEQPKVVPALPFYYEDDSTHYRDLYNAKLDKCHDTGPDVVFQYTPPQNMVVSVDLCSLTEFDSVLSAYERTKPGAKPVSIACNDDSCGTKSKLSGLILAKGTTYFFMVDGWGGTGGKFAINMVVTKVLKALDAKAPRNKAFQPIRSKAVSANALASLRSMPVPPQSHQLHPLLSLPINPTSSHPSSSHPTSSESDGGNAKKGGSGASAANLSFSFASPSHLSHPPRFIYMNGSTPMPLAPASGPGVGARDEGSGADAKGSYRVLTGPWGECSVSCGVGQQQRMAWCVDAQGMTAKSPLASCPLLPAVPTTQPCQLAPCTRGYWDVTQWQGCNVPCGGGVNVRSVVCRDAVQGNMLDDSRCPSAPPSTNQSCNTQPCSIHIWSTRSWSPCQYSLTLLSDVRSGRDGQAGPQCSDPHLCGGRPVGLMLSPTTQNGSCCESGRVDACGVCNGNGSAVDVRGDCCTSGLRDDMGVCCPSARLDACGRCDGDDTSCALLATVAMRVPFSQSVASHALELASSTVHPSLNDYGSLNNSTDGDRGNTSAGDSAGSSSNHHFSDFASAFINGMSEILDVLPQAISFLSITPAPCLPDFPGASFPNQISSATEPNSQAGQPRSGVEQSDHAWEWEGGCGQLDDTNSPRGISVQFVAQPLAVGSTTPRMAETSFREALVQYAQDSMQPPTTPFLGVPGASFISLLSSTRLGICGNNILLSLLAAQKTAHLFRWRVQLLMMAMGEILHALGLDGASTSQAHVTASGVMLVKIAPSVLLDGQCHQ